MESPMDVFNGCLLQQEVMYKVIKDSWKIVIVIMILAGP